MTHKKTQHLPDCDKAVVETHKHHAVWSSSSNGSGEGGGWSLCAFECHEAKKGDNEAQRRAANAAKNDQKMVLLTSCLINDENQHAVQQDTRKRTAVAVVDKANFSNHKSQQRTLLPRRGVNQVLAGLW